MKFILHVPEDFDFTRWGQMEQVNVQTHGYIATKDMEDLKLSNGGTIPRDYPNATLMREGGAYRFDTVRKDERPVACFNTLEEFLSFAEAAFYATGGFISWEKWRECNPVTVYPSKLNPGYWEAEY